MKKYISFLISASLLSISSAAAMEEDEGFKANVAYKIESKWHKDRGKPSSLDAASDGGIYRSPYDSDNTYWYFTPKAKAYKIESKWHKDRGKPSSLDAASDGGIYRSPYDSDNTYWYFTRKANAYKIESKWHKDRGKPSSLDAASDGGIYRSPYDSDNTYWYITEKQPASYKLKVVIENFKYGRMVEDLSALATTSVSAIAWTMDNVSYSTPYTAHPNIQVSKQNENSWSFSESHERSFFNKLDVDVKAQYFGIKGHVHNTTEWRTSDKTLEETMKRTVDTTDVSLVADFVIPPRKRASYSIIWREVDADIPFTANVKVKGFVNWLKKDSSFEEMTQVDADGVLSLLKHAGYKGKLIGKDGKTVLFNIKGNLKAKGAISWNGRFDTSNL